MKEEGWKPFNVDTTGYETEKWIFQSVVEDDEKHWLAQIDIFNLL